MEGQAEYFPRDSFRHGKAVFRILQMVEHALPMERDRVIDGMRDAVFPQFVQKALPFF